MHSQLHEEELKKFNVDVCHIKFYIKFSDILCLKETIKTVCFCFVIKKMKNKTFSNPN